MHLFCYVGVGCRPYHMQPANWFVDMCGVCSARGFCVERVLGKRLKKGSLLQRRRK